MILLIYHSLIIIRERFVQYWHYGSTSDLHTALNWIFGRGFEMMGKRSLPARQSPENLKGDRRILGRSQRSNHPK